MTAELTLATEPRTIIRRGPRASTVARAQQMKSLLAAGLTVRQAGARMGLTPRAADYTAQELRRMQRERNAAGVVDLPVPARPVPGGERWQDAAACRGHDLGLFFGPDGNERVTDRDVRERRAKVLCSACPVRTECLDYALEHREKTGIFGGLNGAERARLKRRRSRRGEAA